MRSVAQRAVQQSATERQAASCKQAMQHQRAQQATYRNKHQRMSEMPVVFEEQQWVLGGADEYIQVRRHSRQAAEPGCHHGLAPGRQRRRQRRAQRSLGYWIHVIVTTVTSHRYYAGRERSSQPILGIAVFSLYITPP